MKLIMLLLILLISGCIEETIPVAINEINVYSKNWDADAEDDGYDIYFSLTDSSGNIVSASGEVYFTILDNDIEVFRSETFPVHPSDFKEQTFVYVLSGYKEIILMLSKRIETNYSDKYAYKIYIHFITTDGKELIGKY